MEKPIKSLNSKITNAEINALIVKANKRPTKTLNQFIGIDLLLLIYLENNKITRQTEPEIPKTTPPAINEIRNAHRNIPKAKKCNKPRKKKMKIYLFANLIGFSLMKLFKN